MTESSKVVEEVKIKYDWYQTDTQVVITILQKNINASELKIDYDSRKLELIFGGLTEQLVFDLLHEIRPDGAQHKLSPFKLEIRLPKAEGVKWDKLEADEKPKETPAKPSKNWDAVVSAEAVAEDNAVDDLFKKIYSEGSDEVRKAMVKSFRESGGTVLSTNWKEVSEGNVTMKPPDGLEWKNWDE